MILVIMGVSGSGKSTVGELLARQLGWEFRDADDFHPPANVAKMAAGTPLTDDDRRPWLEAIAAHMRQSHAEGRGGVIACSALRDRYRDLLLKSEPWVRFVHLTGDFEVIRRRMESRSHFMPPALLESQFKTLETPADALRLDIRHSPEELVAQIRAAFQLD